jgi:serine/threonine protein kinase/formylglycine-generating enzyme required for sulfatase activity
MGDPFIGTTIDKYKIVEPLGRGATADVYKAYQPALDRYVAIKILHSFLATDKEFLRRFQNEAQAAANLRHPRVVQVYDFKAFDDQCYMVMELINGHTLEAQMRKLAASDEIMALDEAFRITRDIASVLSYAHSQGMIHRDVKPANVMINQKNQVILTDFGIAKLLNSTLHTATGSIVGTPYYMAPEQGLGGGGDARSDLYSLGVMLFEMVTGQLPYQAETAVGLLLKHISAPIPIPSQLNPSISPDIDRIIVKALAKNPDNRYQTAAALIEHLDLAENRIPIPDAALPTVSTSPPQPSTSSAVMTEADWMASPYTLSHGRVANNPMELPAVCDAEWDRAAEHFTRGYITRWLRDGINFLRAAHRHALADELEPIVTRAESIVKQVQTEDEIAQSAGLEELLEFLGAPSPILNVVPEEVNLPATGVGEVGRPVTLTITNRGRGYLSGSVVCRVPWLKTPSKRFGCTSGGRCRVTVKPDLSDLPSGRIRSKHALWIHSVGGDQSLAVQVDMLPAVLQVDTSTLDFGTVGQGENAQTMFTLRNSGRGYLEGKISCQVPWLTVSQEQLSLSPGDSTSVTVQSDSRSLPPGDINQSKALVVESTGGQATLDAHIRVLASNLIVEPTRLDLGTMDLVENKAETAILTVRNDGHGVLTGEITTGADWLDVEPTTFRCQAGEAQQLHLSTAQVKVGNHQLTLQVTSNTGTTEVPVLLRAHFSLAPEMVRIPSGGFLRGSSEENPIALTSEKPQRRIYLTVYWIGKYPMTNAQYAAFTEATGRHPPEHWHGDRPPRGEENHPVVNVSWWDAAAYCRWLAEITGEPYRLPTEAQWEKAARGTDGRMYPWGNKWDENKCNAKRRRCHRPKRGTTPVGAFSPAGDSPCGCADMAGNVMEWVSDWYKEDYYAISSISENPYGPASGAVKVLRGGSWSDGPAGVRATNRIYSSRKLTSPEIGFRCALVRKLADPSTTQPQE